jgi:hypothetical protein
LRRLAINLMHCILPQEKIEVCNVRSAWDQEITRFYVLYIVRIKCFKETLNVGNYILHKEILLPYTKTKFWYTYGEIRKM